MQEKVILTAPKTMVISDPHTHFDSLKIPTNGKHEAILNSVVDRWFSQIGIAGNIGRPRAIGANSHISRACRAVKLGGKEC